MKKKKRMRNCTNEEERCRSKWRRCIRKKKKFQRNPNRRCVNGIKFSTREMCDGLTRAGRAVCDIRTDSWLLTICRRWMCERHIPHF